MSLRFRLLASIPALLIAGAVHAQAPTVQTDAQAADTATAQRPIPPIRRISSSPASRRGATGSIRPCRSARSTPISPPRSAAQHRRNPPQPPRRPGRGVGRAKAMPISRCAACRSPRAAQVPAIAGRRPAGAGIRRHHLRQCRHLHRNDLSLARIESVRGGSASTFASNSPGGIINFISKTGEQEGGSFQLSSGLDYREYRADFAYGGKIDAQTRYELSGFYRLGDGPRDVGYDAMRGGQIKANITASSMAATSVSMASISTTAASPICPTRCA